MAWSVQGRRLFAIAVIGIVGCLTAVGIRYTYRKSLDGNWLGHTYYKVNGELVKDEAAGEYLIVLHKDGTYEENSNATSGQWTQTGDVIILRPTKFFDMTPEEHRRKGMDTKGKVSRVVEMLLSSRMKPMVVNYSFMTDRLVFEEHSMRYEYERME